MATHRLFRLGLLVGALLLLALVLPASAQTYRHLSTVHDGSGIMSTNAVNISGIWYTNVSAAGQPGGIFISGDGASGYTNYAGFLQAVDLKRPGQDTDGDGVSDELDTDNDGDGLADTTEVAGDKFDPTTATYVNQADSDGDGVSDYDEAVADTDPHDDHANIRILSIANVADDRRIEYLARSDRDYTIRGWDDSYQYPTNDLGTDSESGGAGSWQVRTNTFDDAAQTNARFYAVEVMPEP